MEVTSFTRHMSDDTGTARSFAQGGSACVAALGEAANSGRVLAAADDATALNHADSADLFTEISRGIDTSLPR
jgi:hypothetical protein